MGMVAIQFLGGSKNTALREKFLRTLCLLRADPSKLYQRDKWIQNGWIFFLMLDVKQQLLCSSHCFIHLLHGLDLLILWHSSRWSKTKTEQKAICHAVTIDLHRYFIYPRQCPLSVHDVTSPKGYFTDTSYCWMPRKRGGGRGEGHFASCTLICKLIQLTVISTFFFPRQCPF